MHKWLDSFGFNMDIITEACSRTIMAIHSPSFEYTDTILSNWAAAGVRHVHDIAKQDEQFRNTKSSVKSIPAAKGTAAGTAKDNAVSNKFNSFSQRTYNYSELEKEILQQLTELFKTAESIRKQLWHSAIRSMMRS